jgi:3-methyladenine DNA glycosylase AlkC
VLYVQRSVANSLNDIGKDHAGLSAEHSRVKLKRLRAPELDSREVRVSRVQ